MKHLAGLLLLLLSFSVFAGPIQPALTGTVTISCTSSSAATALPTMGADQARNIELQNGGTVPIFVEFGTSTQTAAVATGYPVMPGMDKVVTVKASVTHVACIVAVTTTTLYATVGVGD